MALLAAAVSHTPEGEEVLRGARMRMARKPSAVARELLRNFPKGGKRRRKRKRNGGQSEDGAAPEVERTGEAMVEDETAAVEEKPKGEKKAAKPRKRRKPAKAKAKAAGGGDGSEAGEVDLAGADGDALAGGGADEQVAAVVDAVGDS